MRLSRLAASACALALFALSGCLSSGEEEPFKSVAILSQPAPDTLVEVGDSVRFEVVAEGKDLEYQWYRDGVALSGKTSAALKLKVTAALDSSVYHCVVSGAGAEPVATDGVLLRVNVLRIASQPADANTSPGDSVLFSVVATGGKAPYTYVWWGAVGEDTLEFEDEDKPFIGGPVDETPDGLQVWVVVTDSKGAKVKSRIATLTQTFGGLDTLRAGAQANVTLGAAIDLDSGKVWTSATANANLGKIDLVYLYYDGKAVLNGAAAARDSGVKYGINLTNGYGVSVKNIGFVKVSAKPARLSQAGAAYVGGPILRSSAIAAGDKFVVKSTEGRYYYLEVQEVSGTSAGSARLAFAAGEYAD